MTTSTDAVWVYVLCFSSDDDFPDFWVFRSLADARAEAFSLSVDHGFNLGPEGWGNLPCEVSSEDGTKVLMLAPVRLR